MIQINENDLFHIHTYRCGHAEEVSDEAYVQKAIALGKTGIWFSDHAPFPGDMFQYRMMWEEMEGYLSTLEALKEKYREQIQVHIGFEVEYFPHFDQLGYYQKLKEEGRVEFLLLGQHLAEDSLQPGTYTNSWNRERLKKEEHAALAKGICDGINAGYFDAVAHPDRIFQRCREWNSEMEEISRAIIVAAKEKRIPLERNLSSMEVDSLYWEEFWRLADEETPQMIGLDAHSIEELARRSLKLTENI